jgi:hypothetical protein
MIGKSDSSSRSSTGRFLRRPCSADEVQVLSPLVQQTQSPGSLIGTDGYTKETIGLFFCLNGRAIVDAYDLVAPNINRNWDSASESLCDQFGERGETARNSVVSR